MKYVALAVMLCGCSAIDRFGRFQFGDGGGGSNDMAVPSDMVAAADMLVPFGSACTTQPQCAQYNMARAVNCVMNFQGQMFPGGMCTRGCTLGSGACSDYDGVGMGAICTPIGGMGVCLPRCVKAGGPPCRTGYLCCSLGVITNDGVCAPAGTPTVCP